MNDLMTKSFLSYVELKKQAQMDLHHETDLEQGQLSNSEEANLTHFFSEVEKIKSDMQEITALLLDLQSLNEETKSTYSPKILRGLRDRMDSDMVSVLRKATLVKTRLEALDRSNIANRRASPSFSEGSAVDRTRVSTTNGLRTKLKEIMNGFQELREKIMSDYKDGLRRRYFSAFGVYPSDETMDRMITGRGSVEISDRKRAEMVMKDGDVDVNRERHEAVMDIWKSLNRLHQVFLDMAVMVEAQGDGVDDIERNVANAGEFISGGTNSLYYAKKMKKDGKKWMCWVWAVGFVILLVCLVSLLTN